MKGLGNCCLTTPLTSASGGEVQCCCCWAHPSADNGGGVQHPFLRTPADGIPPSSRHPGAVHKYVTFSCVFMLVQLDKCVVVCGSDLQRGHSGDGCLF